MDYHKKYSIAVGALFLLATASYMSGSGLVEASLGTNGVHAGQMKTGILLECINSAAVIGIAALLFPVLQRYSIWIAAAYAASRIAEAVLLSIASVCVLVLTMVTPEKLFLMDVFVSFRNLLFQMAMMFLGGGSILFCIGLYKARLVPRLLSVLGVAGYSALCVSSLMELAGLPGPGMILFIPGAVFEIAFPVWLFVKGFSSDGFIRAISQGTVD